MGRKEVYGFSTDAHCDLSNRSVIAQVTSTLACDVVLGQNQVAFPIAGVFVYEM
jgi:hypothetical protein